MEGPRLGGRGREASLLIPLVFLKAVRGGEKVSQCGGSPSTRKGSMALVAPRWGAHSIRRQVQCRPRRAPCKEGAASFGCYGPSIRPSIRGRSAPDKEWATSAATALPSGGACAGVSPGHLPSPGCQGRDTGPDGVRRWRLSLVPRACARAVGMG